MTEAPKTFSLQSDAYAAFRPRYPADLYTWLLGQTVGREAVWDCATGNGQAAVALAPHFGRVFASDVSEEQIAHAAAAPNITYRCAPAESSGYPAATFDLVCVAQALHWFAYDRFWPEVVRVARPNAFFCAWGYAWFACPPDVSHLLVEPLRALIAPFWASNNRLLWDGYRPGDVCFPFHPVPSPCFAIALEWTAAELVEYFYTWSAYKLALANPAVRDQVDALLSSALARLPLEQAIPISMPLAVIAGRIAPE